MAWMSYNDWQKEKQMLWEIHRTKDRLVWRSERKQRPSANEVSFTLLPSRSPWLFLAPLLTLTACAAVAVACYS